MQAGRHLPAPTATPAQVPQNTLFAQLGEGKAAFYDEGGAVLALCPVKDEIKAKTGFIAWIKNLVGLGDKESVRKSLPVTNPEQVAKAIAHHGALVLDSVGFDLKKVNVDEKSLLARHAKLMPAARTTPVGVKANTVVSRTMFALFMRLANEKAVAQAIGELAFDCPVHADQLTHQLTQIKQDNSITMSQRCPRAALKSLAVDWIAANPGEVIRHRIERLYQGLHAPVVPKAAVLEALGKQLESKDFLEAFSQDCKKPSANCASVLDECIRNIVRAERKTYLTRLFGARTDAETNFPTPGSLAIEGPADSLITLINSPLRGSEVERICEKLKEGDPPAHLDKLLKEASAFDRKSALERAAAAVASMKNRFAAAVKSTPVAKEGVPLTDAAKASALNAVKKLRNQRLTASAQQGLQVPPQESVATWLASIAKINQECFDTYYAGHCKAFQRLEKAKLTPDQVAEIQSHLPEAMDQFRGDAGTRLSQTMAWLEKAITAVRSGTPIVGVSTTAGVEVSALGAYSAFLAQDVRERLFGDGNAPPFGGVLAQAMLKLKNGGYDAATVDQMASKAYPHLLADFERDVAAAAARADTESWNPEQIEAISSGKINMTLVEMLELQTNEKSIGAQPPRQRTPAKPG